MSRGHLSPIWALLFALASQSAHAFFDPPWITPAAPIAGETVSVTIYGGICDAIAEREGYPQITQEGNAVRLLEFGFHYQTGDELCIFGLQTLVVPIGVFPAGEYTLTVDLIYQDPQFGPTIINIGVVPFTVTGVPAVPPVSAPATDLLGVLALVILMVGVAAWALRKGRAGFLILIIACLPFGARAQQTQNACVVMKTTAGAPTAAQVMTWINSSPRIGPPPLDAFKAKVPLGSYWLIPDRATGDFLTWLNGNPNSARKKLEDCQLMTFPIADMPAALIALQADQYVASASVAPSYQFSSVGLIDFGIAPEPLGGGEQYGWFDMNVDAAWALAGGYALIAQIDSPTASG